MRLEQTLLARYLGYLVTQFDQTFTASGLWGKDECKGRGHGGVKYTSLEIWGKAQRESAQRPMSDWGKLEEGGKIFPASKSRGPNSNALVYAERTFST